MKATKIKIRLRSTWLPGQNVQVWRVKALGDEKKGSTVRELPGDGNIETPQTWSSAGIVNRKISYSVDGCLESWILFIKCSIHYMFYFLRCLHVTTFLKREKENTMSWSWSPFSPCLWRFVSQLQLLGMGLYGDVRHSTWALLIQALEVGNYDDRAMSSLFYSKSLWRILVLLEIWHKFRIDESPLTPLL